LKIPKALKRIARPIRKELATMAAIQELRSHGIDITKLAANAERMAGKFSKLCPICGYKGPFRAFGYPPRWDAECPQCLSLERHRHLALLLNEGIIGKNQDILHFAAEEHLATLLRSYAKQYVSADLRECADLKLNLEAIDLPDESFDVIVCSHVLHYVNDRKALPELRRILRKRGQMILLVPIIEGIPTYEDDTLTSAEDRDNHFGHWDHVRIYGSDFRDRLRDAGLFFTEYVAAGRNAVDYALHMGDRIFVCQR
jgi:SAM-dependent methyltransferase